MAVFPQANTIGALFVGLDDTPTGSGNDTVADFTGATETQRGAPSVATPVTAVHSEVDGSRFHINLEGKWHVKARVHHITASSVRVGLGLDNVPGDLTIDPPAPNFTTWRDLALSVNAAGDTVPVIVEADIDITRDMAQDQVAQATGNVRLFLSNNAGAGAAAASLSLAICYIEFTRMGDLPASLMDP